MQLAHIQRTIVGAEMGGDLSRRRSDGLDPAERVTDPSTELRIRSWRGNLRAQLTADEVLPALEKGADGHGPLPGGLHFLKTQRPLTRDHGRLLHRR